MLDHLDISGLNLFNQVEVLDIMCFVLAKTRITCKVDSPEMWLRCDLPRLGYKVTEPPCGSGQWQTIHKEALVSGKPSESKPGTQNKKALTL